jgi:hypothetical protein
MPLSPAYGCEVFGDMPLQDAQDKSITIFSGRVVQIQNFTVDRPNDWYIVAFEVDRYWKVADGEDYDHMIVFTSLDGNTCGYEFETGRHYLVYAIHWWHDPNALYTGLGYRNQPIETAEEDLAFLGEGREPTKQLSWEEQVSRTDIQSLPKPHEEARISMLSMVGIGAAIAGTVAFFSLRRLNRRKS